MCDNMDESRLIKIYILIIIGLTLKIKISNLQNLRNNFLQCLLANCNKQTNIATNSSILLSKGIWKFNEKNILK